MDPGFRSPLIDFFRRGEVASDVRQLAASGGFAPTVLDQVALLLILMDDADPRIAETAKRTIDSLPGEAVGRFIARKDVPEAIRAFFVARGIEPAAIAESEPPAAAAAAEEPLVTPQESDEVSEDTPSEPRCSPTCRSCSASSSR